MDVLRGKLTYANVVATVALIVAVAGIPTAVAVTTAKVKKNSITSKQIKDGAIKASDLANSAVTAAKIADGNVSAPKLASIHPVVDQQGPGGVATAGCAAPERMLSGGSSSGGGNVLASYPEGIDRWRSFTSGGTSNIAYALCLKAAPGP
jgi:trimeric autotransporter adhesin